MCKRVPNFSKYLRGNLNGWASLIDLISGVSSSTILHRRSFLRNSPHYSIDDSIRKIHSAIKSTVYCKLNE